MLEAGAGTIYIEDGVKGRVPFRRYFGTKYDAIVDASRYAMCRDIYYSVYWFQELEDLVDEHGRKITRPNYLSAVVNKIDFDLDAFEKDKTTGIERYNFNKIIEFRKLAQWASRKNLRRYYLFSGGGFHVVISAIGTPLKLRDATIRILGECGIDSDPSVIGDVAQLTRPPNSFNFGRHRQCFCIPLREEEIYLTYDKIKELAHRPRFGESYVYGSESYEFNHCDVDSSKLKLKKLVVKLYENLGADKILEKYGWEISDFCHTIQYILSMKHKGNYLRYELIKYLKTIVKMSFDDCVNLVASLLGREGVHSAIERQASYIYRKNRKFNPSKLKSLGYCKPRCLECLEWSKII